MRQTFKNVGVEIEKFSTINDSLIVIMITKTNKKSKCCYHDNQKSYIWLFRYYDNRWGT